MKKIIRWISEKEIRILLPLCLFAFICFGANLYFQRFNLTTSAVRVGSGAVTIQRLHVVNTSTDVISVGLYDFSTSTNTLTPIPSFTNTAKYIYPLNASIPSSGYISQIQPIDVNGTGSKSVLTFTAGCWVRAWKGAITSSSVSPSDTVYIDIDF